MNAPKRLLRLSPADNVAVALESLTPGSEWQTDDGLNVVVTQPVPAGHKIALVDIAAGQPVRKYGQIIGIASESVEAGAHVHVHNVLSEHGTLTHEIGSGYQPTPREPETAHFMGYVRQTGQVGTRNYIGVIASVNCSATVSKKIAEHFNAAALAGFPSVDGVVSITHGAGCGMGSTGEGIDILRRTLQGYARHPNFVGVLVIGLGCEVNQVARLVEQLPARQAGLFSTLIIQDQGGTRESIAEGIARIEAMLPIANLAKRSPVPLSKLVIGLQCGGSDAYSGITANPVLGTAVDLLVQQGGTAILSETPEIYGAEHLLTSRAASQAVGDKLLSRIAWWEAYTRMHQGDMNNNPSPGNKAGGITTILEKSLGAVAKAGSTGLMAVYEYAEPVTTSGLVFMDSPGYDPVSATGQVASGANLICFTTGRGSTYGCKPVPSLKLATNSTLFERMRLDMDFNAGDLLTGGLTLAQAGQDLLALILATASGQPTMSEQNGLGDNEFVPWQLGAVM
ncbi:UxaA family hydrolase [Leeia oryzae]|uniref:UxaA family hydrolase n=1 Tax=Leeia oryzae TaxID=356662 RepID=UPI0003708986|nr:altronate dehydratase family protein [Leeia oryzae]